MYCVCMIIRSLLFSIKLHDDFLTGSLSTYLVTYSTLIRIRHSILLLTNSFFNIFWNPMLESDEQQGCNCNIIHNICHNTNHHRLIYSERNTDESCPECDTMITMRISAGENLSRLGKHLTAIYNIDAPPTIPGIRSNSLSYFFSSSTDLQSTFVIPCLSLSSKEREYDNNNNNSNEELYDEESAMLLSRMSRFGQHTMSAAPILSLQNFVKSFGHIFEYHLQRKIKSVLYKARERQEQRWMDYNASSNTIHNNSSSMGGKKPNQLQALIDALRN